MEGPVQMLLFRFPRLAGAFGLLVTVVFGFLGISAWKDLQTMPDGPEPLALPAAVARVASGQDVWVTLERVEWDCDNIVYSEADPDADTDVVFTDESRTVLGVAKFSARLTCTEIREGRASGVLSLMNDGFYERLAGRGFDLAGYEHAAARVTLCTYCGRGNSTLLVILAALFVPLGLALYPLARYMNRRYSAGEH